MALIKSHQSRRWKIHPFSPNCIQKGKMMLWLLLLGVLCVSQAGKGRAQFPEVLTTCLFLGSDLWAIIIAFY